MDPSGSSTSIRRASPRDASALVQIETASFTGDRLSPRSLRRHLASPRADIFVAVNDNQPVGYALVLYRAGSRLARLYSIAVIEARRGMGIAGALVAACETAARKRKCDSLRLEVREDNAAAIRAYARMDYETFGRIADYYDDGETAIRMQKPLAARAGKPAAERLVA